LVRRDGWFYFVIPIKKETEIKQRYDGVVGVDLGLRYNAVITLFYKSRKITEVEFLKYRRHMHKIRMLWHRIDELKSMLPKGQRTSKRIQRLWKRGKIVKYTTYKANWEGIKVKLVNAKNTSKTRHLCARFENRCIFLLRTLPTHLQRRFQRICEHRY